MVVMPPGCWPVDETHAADAPVRFATLERALTSWLRDLGTSVPPSHEVADRVGRLYSVAARVSDSVAPVPEVAYVVRGRDPTILPMPEEDL